MAGKSSNVTISKERFKEMFKLRNTSEKRFGNMLEEKGIISYRQFQRNLHDGNINYFVLDKCADLLDCSIDYLAGNEDIIYIDEIKRYFEKKEKIDSTGAFVGFYIPAYELENRRLFWQWVISDEYISFDKYFDSIDDLDRKYSKDIFYACVREYISSELKRISKKGDDLDDDLGDDSLF